MIYKQFLQKHSKKSRVSRAFLVTLIKVTIVTLAAAFLLTSVLLIADMITDGDDGREQTSKDKTPPTIRLKEGDTIYMYVGENISFRNQVSVNDESSNVKLDFDSNVNADVTGTYSVTYTATDDAGNRTQLTVPVVVTKKEYTYDMLMTTMDVLVKSANITNTGDKQKLIFDIYAYVNSASTIKFTNESNVPNINRANWKSDWIEEAMRAIDSKQGDCYSYYSLSKAFFEYFGIENMGVQRDKTKTNMSGTHFWSVVNIGTKSAPKWYFYDATRLKGKFADGSNDACLRTAEEMQGYIPSKTSDYGFYGFDGTGYPKIQTQKIAR